MKKVFWTKTSVFKVHFPTLSTKFSSLFANCLIPRKMKKSQGASSFVLITITIGHFTVFKFSQKFVLNTIDRKILTLRNKIFATICKPNDVTQFKYGGHDMRMKLPCLDCVHCLDTNFQIDCSVSIRLRAYWKRSVGYVKMVKTEKYSSIEFLSIYERSNITSSQRKNGCNVERLFFMI